LPHDNWAILTVLVLMSAQFVGSITVKAIMRLIGTIAGALVGVWLVGDYTSTPAIFLPVLFLAIALASYKFGQLGGSQRNVRQKKSRLESHSGAGCPANYPSQVVCDRLGLKERRCLGPS
jgi:hypothetical protein